MPRTKRPVKKQEKAPEEVETLIKFERKIAELKQRLNNRVEIEIRNLELTFKILEGSLSKDLHKTIGQLKTEIHLKEVTNTDRTGFTSRANSNDDGYLTQDSSHGSGDRGVKKTPATMSSMRTKGRRSRSADASSRKTPAPRTKTVQRRRSQSVYKTPAYNKMALNSYPVITPKVAPHTPLTVLRQPRQGEMVVSMTGSPVMVPSYNTMQRDEKANCNILLEDGTMLSLQPKELHPSAYIPFTLMDPSVLSQLKTLKENLGKVLALGEKQDYS